MGSESKFAKQLQKTTQKNNEKSSDLQALQAEYQKLQAAKAAGKLTLSAVNRYVVNTKYVLDKMNIKSEIIVTDNKKVLRILPTQDKNKLNRLAFSLDKNFRGLKVEINPHATLTDDALGFYFSETNTLVLAEINDQAITLADSTFDHEIRHASMTFRYILREIDNLFNTDIAKKESAITDKDREDNNYAEYLSMQELSTFPIEAKQTLALMKTDITPEQRKKFEADIQDVLLQTQKLSEYVYDTMVIFTEALHKNEIKSSIQHDNFLDKSYDTLVLETTEFTFTIPYFEKMKLQNRGQLIFEHIENNRSFSLELWTASTDASEAYDKWFNNRTDANWKIALEKIDIMTAVTRHRLAF